MGPSLGATVAVLVVLPGDLLFACVAISFPCESIFLALIAGSRTRRLADRIRSPSAWSVDASIMILELRNESLERIAARERSRFPTRAFAAIAHFIR